MARLLLTSDFLIDWLALLRLGAPSSGLAVTMVGLPQASLICLCSALPALHLPAALTLSPLFHTLWIASDQLDLLVLCFAYPASACCSHTFPPLSHSVDRLGPA
eukprot:1159330-Pelagomonas_calceolata.AAC.6